jgi:5'-nucleotidase
VAVSGTPSDCILFGLYSKEFEKPSLVLSGINWGDNTGVGSVLGSGTLAACWQAALEGVPAIAFSLAVKNKEWRKKESWGDTTKLRAKIEQIVKMLKPKLKQYHFFNVNIPTEYDDSEIIFINKFQRKRYTTEVVKRIDPDHMPYYWITGDAMQQDESSDFFELTKSGKIVISELSLSCFNRG